MKRFAGPGAALAQSDLSEFAAAFRFPLRTIFSFEFALVLLISVGAYKKNPDICLAFPHRRTLIMGAICAVGILRYMMANGLQRKLVDPCRPVRPVLPVGRGHRGLDQGCRTQAL